MLRKTLKKEKKAVSPAISAVIISATTIVLVLVASTYAYQVLERQRGASEFDAVKKSFITLDDAIRDVAWDKSGARSARFTINYGLLEVIPDDERKGGLPITVSVSEYSEVKYSSCTGYVRYILSTSYVTFGNNYISYIFGDEKPVISKAAESFGTAIINQQPNWVFLTLYYRVRALRTSVVKVGTDTVNYVEISLIKITATKHTYTGDLDLTARNINIATQYYGPFDFNAVNPTCTVSVSIGEPTGQLYASDSLPITLEPGTSGNSKVVFTFAIAEVKVSA